MDLGGGDSFSPCPVQKLMSTGEETVAPSPLGQGSEAQPYRLPGITWNTACPPRGLVTTRLLNDQYGEAWDPVFLTNSQGFPVTHFE
jgi:hypothetical protein